MAASKKVELVVTARDRTRGVFRRLRRAFGGLRGQILALAGGLTFGALARQATNFATSINAASERLGITVEEMQALRTIAQDSNVNFETLVTVMQRLSANAGDAKEENAQMAMAWQRLGISVRDLRGMNSPTELLLAVADAAKAGSDDLDVLRARLRDVGDTEINRMLPMLIGGADQLLEAMEGVNVAGAESIKTVAEREADLRRELLVVNEAMVEVMRELLPAMQQLAETLPHVTNLLVGAVETVESMAEAAAEARMVISGDVTDPARVQAVGDSLTGIGTGNPALQLLQSISASNEEINRKTSSGVVLDE